MKNKLGKLRVQKSLLLDAPEIMGALFKKFIPLRIEENEHDILLYTGISPDFRELKEGDVTPFYEGTMINHGADSYSCSLDEIKH